MKPPFPYFGGKRAVASRVWSMLGDPAGYVEPFAGSAAVLLARPGFKGRRVETLNDADGWLVNAWRAVQSSPYEVAIAAWGPVTEIDYHARLLWLHTRRDDDLVSWLEGDPEAHDAKAAGWWLYVMAAGIGDPWDGGPWVLHEGRMTDRRTLGGAGRGVNRKLPHLGNAGQGVNRELPHLGDAGKEALIGYMQQLAERLQRVRITCGDWRRVVTPSVAGTGTAGDGGRAIFLDPPYSTSGDLYAHGSGDVSHDVKDWCLSDAANGYRIILCGYDTDHDTLLDHGWAKSNGKATTGGYGAVKGEKRERLWASPECLGVDTQTDLFEAATL